MTHLSTTSHCSAQTPWDCPYNILKAQKRTNAKHGNQEKQRKINWMLCQTLPSELLKALHHLNQISVLCTIRHRHKNIKQRRRASRRSLLSLFSQRGSYWMTLRQSKFGRRGATEETLLLHILIIPIIVWSHIPPDAGTGKPNIENILCWLYVSYSSAQTTDGRQQQGPMKH